MNRACVLVGLSALIGLGCGDLGRSEQPRSGTSPEVIVSPPRQAQTSPSESSSPAPAAAPSRGQDEELLRQTRERLFAAARLEPGMVVADIGASRGWFVDRAAIAVGSEGRVYATDIDADAIAALRELVTSDHPARAPVEVRSCTGERDTGLRDLGDGEIDVMLMIDSLCFDGRFSRAENLAYLRELARVLRPGGRLIHHVDCACEVPLAEAAELFEAVGFTAQVETLELPQPAAGEWSCRSPQQRRRHARLLRLTKPK